MTNECGQQWCLRQKHACAKRKTKRKSNESCWLDVRSLLDNRFPNWGVGSLDLRDWTLVGPILWTPKNSDLTLMFFFLSVGCVNNTVRSGKKIWIERFARKTADVTIRLLGCLVTTMETYSTFAGLILKCIYVKRTNLHFVVVILEKYEPCQFDITV